jgi:diaminohydroxyphosphoribosylaminopyrimidine deaminase/5-amino-6-(5-phosphoribosylamino)uracil reductase
MDSDYQFMLRALTLASKGGRSVMPNPFVGAVIVHNGVIIGEGFHKVCGEAHAEVEAVRSVQNPAFLSESTLYVTLEPCAHFGRTPPCTTLILESQIPRVVIGCRDPFPRVDGKGIQILEQAGVSVQVGVLEDECLALNKRFITAHQKKRPFIILKWAETSDGFIARADGSSKWISSEASRTLVHQWRAEEMSILVGSTTAVCDDPHLTVRHTPGQNPLRLVIDRTRSLPPSLHLFDVEAATWIFNEGVDECDGKNRFIKCDFSKSIIAQILAALHAEGILSIIVEGGSRTIASFLNEGLWDEARVFRAPVTFHSGIAAPSMNCEPFEVEASGVDQLVYYRKA